MSFRVVVAIPFAASFATLFTASLITPFATPIVTLITHRSCILSFSNSHDAFSFRVAVATPFVAPFASPFAALIVASFAHCLHTVRAPFVHRFCLDKFFPLFFT
ncbi:hypothetical protein DEO72_LG2g4510 [Vigna unguiculata]|uniref:Uncharacterized protein n=1 Tax=Vigna unguiculata TaxID=3917 RepID=A0A4D6L6Q7_VIGUN|nr:hypothetical protein DEO72_LG2g4510 [Vigna unguiculata]